MTLQEQIDKLLKEIQESIKLVAIPKVFISKDDKYKSEVLPIPENASDYEKTVMESINYLRQIQRCPQCNPDQGGIQTLDENGKWNCFIHKD